MSANPHPSVVELRAFYSRTQELMTDSESAALEQVERIVAAASRLKAHCEDESLDADDNGEQLGALFEALEERA